MAQSDSQCEGATVWALGWQRVPLDEGQASLGEALVTVHTCSCCFNHAEGLQFRVLHVVIAPEGKDSPWWLRLPMVFNIIHNIKLLPRTLHCKLYYLHLRIQEKTVNR